MAVGLVQQLGAPQEPPGLPVISPTLSSVPVVTLHLPLSPSPWLLEPWVPLEGLGMDYPGGILTV